MRPGLGAGSTCERVVLSGVGPRGPWPWREGGRGGHLGPQPRRGEGSRLGGRPPYPTSPPKTPVRLPPCSRPLWGPELPTNDVIIYLFMKAANGMFMRIF